MHQLITLNAILVMGGLQDMGVIVIKVNGSIILKSMLKQENMCCSIIQKEDMDIGSLETNAMS